MNSVLIIVLSALGGFVIGALAVWVAMAAKLARRTAELDAERRARADDRAANERFGAERERTQRESIAAMIEKVTNVTNEALKMREKELSARNRSEVVALLEPMRQQLDAMRRATEAATKCQGEIGLKMEGFCNGLRNTSLVFGQQAKSFTDALTGANKKQGNWGESILGQVLENCGLKEGVHYVAQTGSGGGIPDYQVFDPCSKKILIIDSKMSWTKYEESYRMEPGPERNKALREHADSVRRHIDELYKADYPGRQEPLRAGYSFIPLTAMFVPCDAALAAAVEEAPELVDYAFKRHVALVSPLTLFGFFELVSIGWAKYNSDRNSSEIVAQAKLLVTYVDRLFVKLEALGKGLKDAGAAYEDAMKLAVTEPSGQCIKGPALKILKLDVKTDRALASKTLK